MQEIFETNLPINAKNFWINIGIVLEKRINGKIKILYNEFENSIIIKIFIERFNYTICISFPRWKLMEHTEIINQSLNAVRFRIYDEIFK